MKTPHKKKLLTFSFLHLFFLPLSVFVVVMVNFDLGGVLLGEVVCCGLFLF